MRFSGTTRMNCEVPSLSNNSLRNVARHEDSGALNLERTASIVATDIVSALVIESFLGFKDPDHAMTFFPIWFFFRRLLDAQTKRQRAR